MDPVSARRLLVFDAMLGLFPPGRLIDLGAGHGIFSVRASRKGWQVTAVDARTTRFPDDPSVTWRHQDVRETDLSGYDLILCLGLFYHLTLRDQLDLLARCSGTPLIIDTHLDVGKSDHVLSERQQVDGYEGRFYSEGAADTPLSSWGNELSFWPTPESFARMLAEHGYPVVLSGEPPVVVDRRFHLALPGPPVESVTY